MCIRDSLEFHRQPRSSDYIVCQDDFFRFNTDAPHSVDLFDFCDAEALARKALRQGEQERALDLLEKAVQLYRGDLFSDDSEDESVEAHRVRLRHTYLDAVRMLAQARDGAPTNARTVGDRSVTVGCPEAVRG